MPLPEFIPPMLAKIGEPFDDPDWIFEIKWDGTRALAFVEGGDYRLLNRKANPQRERYPELAGLAGLPDGTVLDGEIAVLIDGRPSFHGMLRREQARGERRVALLAQSMPAVYVVFDLLWRAGESIVDWTLADRRAALRELMGELDTDLQSTVVFSDGVIGQGLAYFEQACAMELEGVVAKRLASRYLPGKRSDSWLKIKQSRTAYCAILGFLPDGERDLRSLVIGLESGGELVYAGRVGSGLDDVRRRALNDRLRAHVRPTPFISVPSQGGEEVIWVEPNVFCRVKFLEHTPDGQLRAPVFLDTVAE
ncbi:MAG: non-homologous end-joining DNA ligase [bacterium]